MNKSLAAGVIILAVAVVLLSGAVLYLSRCQFQNRLLPAPQAGIPGDARLPFAAGQPPGMSGGLPPPHAGPDRQGKPQLPPSSQPGAGSMGRPADNAPPFAGLPAAAADVTDVEWQARRLMMQSRWEAQQFFRSQDRRPDFEEMDAKVRELAEEKMKAGGIPEEIQNKVLNGPKPPRPGGAPVAPGK